MKSFSVLAIAGPLFVMSAVVLSVILYTYSTKKVGADSPFHLEGDQPEDTVIFDAAPQKINGNQIENYLFQNGGIKLREAGETFYQNGRRFNIDPAFALALAKTETGLGMGMCDDRIGITTWQACNNFFCLEYDSRIFKETGDGQCSRTKWASFSSMERGITAFYQYIDIRYLRSLPSQNTVSAIGCTSASYTRCYCKTSGEDCKTWADAVTKTMKEIRASGENDKNTGLQ